LACDCVRLVPGTPRFQADIDAIAAFYPVAAEGVIERDGPYAWRFRTTHEYRGPRQGAYRITLISDCSLGPDEMNALLGKAIFALLVEGPGDHKGNYELGRCVNLQGSGVEKALRERMTAGCPKQ
jgi:hypothetical protein